MLRENAEEFRTADLAHMLWVDECYIVVAEYFNLQNERCYGRSFDLISDCKNYRLVPKSPFRAMVFVAVWSAGRSDLVILPSGFKINSYTYVENCLKPMLKPLPTHLDLKKIILYQDIVPAHRAKKTQTFLKDTLPRFARSHETPPNSPDLNPLDYCLWSILKDKLDKYDLVPNFDRLSEILRKEWTSIPQQVIRDSCEYWQRLVRQVERANGYHID